MEKSADDLMTTWRSICTRAWSDEEFKSRLKQDPRKVLEDEGWDVPSDIRLKVVENKPDVMHLILPARPEDIGRVERASSRFVDQYGPISL
jgi:hypothetical protein